MNDFLKASGYILVAVTLCLVLSGQNKYFATLISMLVCAIVAAAALCYIQPTLDFFYELQTLGNWNSELLTILLKAVGIGILTQITVLICSDSGNAALGKALQIMSTAVILWLSLPLFTELLALVNELLVKI